MRLFDFDKMQPEDVSLLYQRKLALGENIVLARVEVKKSARTDPHRHDNEELIIVLSGAWKFNLPGREIVLTQNQVLQIPPGVEHSSEAIEDTVALDISTPTRYDWITGNDHSRHNSPDDFLWGV